MRLKKIYSKAVRSSKFVFRFELERLIRREIANVETMTKATSWAKINFIGLRQLLLTHNCDSNRRATCHIICSGYSALNSTHKVKIGSDYVIGFGFGGLIDLPFNLYMVEFGTFEKKYAGQSVLYAELIQRFAAGRIKKIYFKNIWEGKIDPNFLSKTYGPDVCVLKDFLMPEWQMHVSKGFESLVARAFFIERGEYIAQWGSTALTAVNIAFRLGFPRIVLHGFDGVGPHFFSINDIGAPNDWLIRLRQFYPSVPQWQKHISASLIWPYMKTIQKELNDHNVSLLCASNDSPLANILPIYS